MIAMCPIYVTDLKDAQHTGTLSAVARKQGVAGVAAGVVRNTYFDIGFKNVMLNEFREQSQSA